MELMYRYYMCMGYAVRVAIPIPYKKRVGGTERTFYQFIDLMAIKEDEVVLVECRDFKNVKKVGDSIKRLITLFERATAVIPSRYSVIRRILVVEDRDLEKISPYEKILKNKGIELLPISKILKDIVECSFREEEYRKARGEGDVVLAIIRTLCRYLHLDK